MEEESNMLSALHKIPIWVRFLIFLVIIGILAGISDYFKEKNKQGYTIKYLEQYKNNQKRYTQQQFEKGKELVQKGLTDAERKELNRLTTRAISKLPDKEKRKLIKLQIQFAEEGYEAMSDKEIKTMRKLNSKAVSLLSKSDKERLFYLMKKANRK